MSNITIHQLEPDLTSRLEQRAAQHGYTIEAEPSPLDLISANATIWHNRVLKNVIRETVNFFEIGSSQVGIAQNVACEHSSIEIGSHQISVSQVAPTDFSIPHLSINQGSISQVNTEHRSASERGSSQISPTEVSSIQTSRIELSSNQNSTAQIDIFQIGIGQILPAKINSTQTGVNYLINPNPIASKISDSTSIESQNFFVTDSWLLGYNPNLQNTTVPTWTSFLQSPTPFNLKLEVTDLPTGQLAEATITGYDTSNRTNSGTLTLDINGNGSGWFMAKIAMQKPFPKMKIDMVQDIESI